VTIPSGAVGAEFLIRPFRASPNIGLVAGGSLKPRASFLRIVASTKAQPARVMDFATALWLSCNKANAAADCRETTG